MIFGSSEKEKKPLTPEQQLAESVSDLFRKTDLFGVADLLCKQSPDMVRRVLPEIKAPTSLQLKPDGDFELKIGNATSYKSVTISKDTCVDWNKK